MLSPRHLAACSIALALALVALPGPAAEGDVADLDLTVLREQGIATSAEALIGYLRKHSFDDDEAAAVKELISQLGSDEFAKREKASAELVTRGKLAVPFLEQALHGADPEMVRRARQCLAEIDSSDRPEVSAAVIRTLARSKTATGVPALLRFAPHAEDAQVEDEIIAALVACGIRDGKASRELLTALESKRLALRMAAAGAVARAEDATQRGAVVKLLADAAPLLRYRIAEGLLVRHDRAGIKPLVDLLADAPAEIASRAESLLCRMGGEEATEIASALGGTNEERKRWRDAWETWRKKHGDKIDLASLEKREEFLGYTLVPEMHGGKVWECDRTGKVRWTIEGLSQPRDAQVLPNGHVLICEVSGGNRITERDLKGKIHWSLSVNDPAYVERLPNGNTFIGTHNRAWEITSGGKEVFSYEPGDMFIHSMHRRPNGNVVCLGQTGVIREVDRKRNVVCTINIGIAGNWSGVQGLPGNRYLAVELNQGLVLELDNKGKKLWECKVAGASYAVRRPNGRTLVCSFNGSRVVDVDSKGNEVWEKKVGTMPWRVHSR
jgi:HEAT repeat protein